jgi:hypothetical protein
MVINSERLWAVIENCVNETSEVLSPLFALEMAGM